MIGRNSGFFRPRNRRVPGLNYFRIQRHAPTRMAAPVMAKTTAMPDSRCKNKAAASIVRAAPTRPMSPISPTRNTRQNRVAWAFRRGCWYRHYVESNDTWLSRQRQQPRASRCGGTHVQLDVSPTKSALPARYNIMSSCPATVGRTGEDGSVFFRFCPIHVRYA